MTIIGHEVRPMEQTLHQSIFHLCLPEVISMHVYILDTISD